MSSVPVTVNFNVNVDASGNIEVFGQAPVTLTDIVVCLENLSVTTLYDTSSNAVFEFQEPMGPLGTRVARRMTAWDQSGNLRTGFENIITGDMDASGAIPFDLAKYASNLEYYQHESLGRLILSMYAHYLFGHVAATAAITNDETFINNINGNTEGTALLGKGITELIDSMSDSDALAIVEQVLGQDASRAMDFDNNALAPGRWQALRFFAGDKVFIQVNVKQPSVTVSNNAAVAQQSEPLSTQVIERTYNLQITLA
jgi:hypothetical protein